jgi:hypothetical protein
MMAHPVRGDINWFNRRLLQSPPAKVTPRRSTVVTPLDERRSFITLGLMVTFASLAAQTHPRWSCHLRKNCGSAAVAAPLYRCQPRARQGLTVYVPQSQGASESPSGAGNARIVDDFDVFASSGVSRQPGTALLVNLHFIPFHCSRK